MAETRRVEKRPQVKHSIGEQPDSARSPVAGNLAHVGTPKSAADMGSKGFGLEATVAARQLSSQEKERFTQRNIKIRNEDIGEYRNIAEAGSISQDTPSIRHS